MMFPKQPHWRGHGEGSERGAEHLGAEHHGFVRAWHAEFALSMGKSQAEHKRNDIYPPDQERESLFGDSGQITNIL